MFLVNRICFIYKTVWKNLKDLKRLFILLEFERVKLIVVSFTSLKILIIRAILFTVHIVIK